jgi:hypothetical protein
MVTNYQMLDQMRYTQLVLLFIDTACVKEACTVDQQQHGSKSNSEIHAEDRPA